MENNNYIPNNNVIMPQEKTKKKNKLKKWLIISILILVTIFLYIGYTFLLGSGRFLGTWVHEDGNTTYEFELFGKGTRKQKYRNYETVFSFNWEYDDSTKCLIIEVEAEINPWIEAFEVKYIDGEVMKIEECNTRGTNYIDYYKVN